MNVYEEAHDLARAIKESNEFKEFDCLKKEVDQDPQLSAMLKDLQMKQIQLQTKQMAEGKLDSELMGQIQSRSPCLRQSLRQHSICRRKRDSPS